MRHFSVFLTFLTLTLIAGQVAAQVQPVPQRISIQMRLTKPDGNPVADGKYSVLFSLWDALNGGNQKWSQTASVSVQKGVFTTLLDTSTGDAKKFHGNLWLEIKVGSDPPLSPRQVVGSVAYAMKADLALGVKDGSITSASIADGTLSAADFAPNLFNPIAWLLTGNSGTDFRQHFVGTTDNEPLVLRTNSRRAMLYRYASDVRTLGQEFRSINVLGGADINSIAVGVVGGTIAGGGFDSFTGSDSPNQVTADFGTVGGGRGNTADRLAFVGGGMFNTASGDHAFVGGGTFNSASGEASVIAGGGGNDATAHASTVGGGESNLASGYGSVIAGGGGNEATDVNSTVGGGEKNTVSGEFSVIAGGSFNTAIGPYNTIGGGKENAASNGSSTIGGGEHNLASGEDSVIAGGRNNKATAFASTVGGGSFNSATGSVSTVGGGVDNLASGDSATVCGGFQNTAGGDMSFASGYLAKATHKGSFVWADTTNAEFVSTAANQFSIRASGGVRIVSYHGTRGYLGVVLPPGDSAWSALSDRNTKHHFQPVQVEDILERLAVLPITTWNYKGVENPIRHIGPMAQDFYAAFGVGLDDKHISTIDADGVALAAIQGLYRKVQAQEHRLTHLEAENTLLKQQLAENALLKQQLRELSQWVQQVKATQEQIQNRK